MGSRNSMVETGMPRMKISGGSGVSTMAPPCVIAQLRESYQHNLGKIQRETLSKTVRGAVKRWPTLTVRDCVIFGEVVHGEQDSQELVLQHGDHT